jgi:hypothetical protein
MSRKEELFKMVRLLHSQADAMSSRDAKQAFRKMADHYQREAEHLQGRPVPEIFNQNKQANSTKSAA